MKFLYKQILTLIFFFLFTGLYGVVQLDTLKSHWHQYLDDTQRVELGIEIAERELKNKNLDSAFFYQQWLIDDFNEQ